MDQNEELLNYIMTIDVGNNPTEITNTLSLMDAKSRVLFWQTLLSKYEVDLYDIYVDYLNLIPIYRSIYIARYGNIDLWIALGARTIESAIESWNYHNNDVLIQTIIERFDRLGDVAYVDLATYNYPEGMNGAQFVNDILNFQSQNVEIPYLLKFPVRSLKYKNRSEFLLSKIITIAPDIFSVYTDYVNCTNTLNSTEKNLINDIIETSGHYLIQDNAITTNVTLNIISIMNNASCNLDSLMYRDRNNKDIRNLMKSFGNNDSTKLILAIVDKKFPKFSPNRLCNLTLKFQQ